MIVPPITTPQATISNLFWNNDQPITAESTQEPPYTTIYADKQQKPIKDESNPPVLSIMPNSTDLKVDDGMILNIDNTKLIEPNSNKILNFEIPNHIDIVDESAITADNKIAYKELETNGSFFFNEDNLNLSFYSTFNTQHQQIDMLDSATLVDYIKNHISKLDNQALDQLAYQIAKEKLDRSNDKK